MRRFGILVLLVLTGCGATTNNAGRTPSPTPSPTSTPAASCTPSAGDEIEAQDFSFTPSCLGVKANLAFKLKFKNQDAGIMHSVAIYRDDAFSDNVFPGSVITGKSEKLYDIPALAPATYRFRCEVHHTMTGTLIAS